MGETPPADADRNEAAVTGQDLEDVTAALLSRPLELSRRDVSRDAHVGLSSARRFWQALGFPLVNNDELLFTRADVDALEMVAGLVRRGDLDEATALQLTRAFARTTDRLASWQVQLVAESLDPEREAAGDLSVDHSSRATAQATARYLVSLADDLEPLLVYAWRRHLADAVSRLLTDAEPETAEEGIYRHIGFADLVAFSRLVRKSTERELSEIVKRFEALSADVVTAHGGRIVKTVGDEILFSNRNAAPAAATAIDLVEAITTDELLPDVRVGLAAGRVMPKLGDVFGTAVNRAARLTAIAHPGSVLVDDVVADSLHDVSGFELTPLRPRTLRGVGKVEPYLLARATTAMRRSASRSPTWRSTPTTRSRRHDD
jgi:adenylate cyclase